MRKGALLFLMIALWVPVQVGAEEPTGQVASVTVEIIGSPDREAKAEAALLKVPGVTEAKVSYRRQTAAVKYDPQKVNIGTLVDALGAAGFKATPVQANYICPTCQGTYQSKGDCLICEVTLQPLEEETRKKEK
ncbi:MAG: heavy-metal-associated domain-containing protein [Candidatus Omnitrophica bacterium]|nr:heavy-metal-associated domain-containing protein [Candidatus Omnitrophota bacterium]